MSAHTNSRTLNGRPVESQARAWIIFRSGSEVAVVAVSRPRLHAPERALMGNYLNSRVTGPEPHPTHVVDEAS